MNYTISIFKSVKDPSGAFNRSVFYVLDRIKNGKSKEQVDRLRTLTPEQYDKQKSILPGACFNGTFNHRSAAGLTAKSGLIILDFDKFETTIDAMIFRDSISSDEYVFACWLSPSAKGVKVLIKIPVDNKTTKSYFEALEKHFNHPNWDVSGSDVSRFCFESYDPELYLNPDSSLWLTSEEPDIDLIGTFEPVLAIKSDNRIIENLMSWFDKKYGANKGSRNTNLFKLASAFSDFGISKSECENVLSQFQSADFRLLEINNVIKSAYRKVENFGTKFFEDTKTREKIEKQIRAGKKNKEIKASFAEYTETEIEKCITGIKENISIVDFWHYDEENKIKLSPHKYKFWLQQENFFKYFPADSNTYTFIKKEQNLIEETNEKRIKDFVLDNLLSRPDIGFKPYDFMAAASKYFSSDFLSFLESADIKLKEDTIDECYIYYKNCVVKTTVDKVETIDYIDVDGYIWKRQIIDREFSIQDHHEAVFRKFIWLSSGKNIERYNSFKSVIGYMMHSFKTSANNKAIIFNDETISENPNGGSGKGLFWNALAQMKKVSSIDGKTFEFTKSFPYQTVSTDTQILVFDDVKKNFNFESLFSLITEGITLEYKGQDAIKLPVTKSPKILITTNYTIGGVGGSFERRKFEVEMSDYFSYKHTPLDEFGHMLFDEWDTAEWLRFDNYMLNCVQYYLENGLQKHDFHNLELRKFIKNTSFEFYEWTKEHENIPLNVRNNKGEYFRVFTEEYQDFKKWLSQKRFKQWLEAYAKFYDYKYIEGNTNGNRWFEVERPEGATLTTYEITREEGLFG